MTNLSIVVSVKLLHIYRYFTAFRIFRVIFALAGDPDTCSPDRGQPKIFASCQEPLCNLTIFDLWFNGSMELPPKPNVGPSC